ncbi:hypothetical protein SAMN06273572_101320 [Monaibacterium marinum]|uniref:DUF6473 domain-containing protein n=1 Tax=Pontivivens marinum TaxID=1690039 RepID=A0A2C9CMK0_9RHOB|nr:DUF6473 family protein [Monaibacterium marinum]SOH92473.1 hypothetical protein SAMN06273572_101320 [Monaibacterium marinum]
MSFQSVLTTGVDYQEYRWGRARQVFRGPKPDLRRPYVACIGGSETYGRFAREPWPQQLDAQLGHTCANWGTPGAGASFYLKDPVVLEACSNARACVISIMGAHVVSNRLYSVYNRRNLRLRTISPMMQALYPEVEFDQYRFVHNMLAALYRISPQRFAVVELEMRQAWLARMTELLADIETRKILFWFSDTSPDEAGRMQPLAARDLLPSFVDREMIDALRPHADIYVEYVASSDAANGPRIPGRRPPQVARRSPSHIMHVEGAELLSNPVSRLLGLSMM